MQFKNNEVKQVDLSQLRHLQLSFTYFIAFYCSLYSYVLNYFFKTASNIFKLIFYFLLALENDLGEVETSWPFIVNFCYKMYFKDISYQDYSLLQKLSQAYQG